MKSIKINFEFKFLFFIQFKSLTHTTIFSLSLLVFGLMNDKVSRFKVEEIPKPKKCCVLFVVESFRKKMKIKLKCTEKTLFFQDLSEIRGIYTSNQKKPRLYIKMSKIKFKKIQTHRKNF